ncbi:39_t:CDS:2 [Scutellospora calospora]|uniref:39_t:CDS:1 n=1 Tax=Scutellospora calospora TaxID=85575 RepID=A0ACA9LQ15_9GLOM|nr:39_t:CDS:2 [Scutellospora calospora]
MSSSTNTQESENAMCNILRSTRHVLAMDIFVNELTLAFLKLRVGETVEILYDLSSGAEAIRIGYEFLRQIIAIINIATLVHIEALVQILYQIRNCSCHIISMFYQKNSNELFHSLGHENIRAELESARPNNLPTAIKGHREWNNNIISYKVNKSLAIITFIEVEHQKYFSARYFIEKLCSLIASTIRVEALVIKETDFNAVATSQNLGSEEAENFNAIEGLVAKDFAQWEDTCYKADENLEKSVAENLCKNYSANY